MRVTLFGLGTNTVVMLTQAALVPLVLSDTIVVVVLRFYLLV